MIKRDFECSYCGLSNCKLVLPVNNVFSIYQCCHCYINFTYPQESIVVKKENDRKYNSKEDERSYLDIYDQVYKRAKEYVRETQKHKKFGKYLDIGCSYGIYLKAAKEAGFETYAVEIASNAASIARKKFGLDVFTGTLEQAKYKTNTFDVVTLYDVLEHIPDIKKFLKEIYRIMKPGGLLVIQSPNVESYAFKILETDWNWLLVPHHLWHFSNKSLGKVLVDNRFSVIKYVTWDSPYEFASNWVTKIGLTKINATFLQKLVRKIVYLFLYLGIYIGSLIWARYNKGGSQIAYATKN